MESNEATRILLLVLLDIGLLAGWLLIPLGLGGNFILLGLALVVAIASGFTTIGWPALLIVGGAVGAGEVLEMLLGSLVAARYGASRRGQIGAFLGALIGGVAGTAVLPVIGSILGSFAGTAVGAIVAEKTGGSNRSAGLRAGWGAFVGRAMSIAVKMAIGAGIIVFIVLRTHR
jgi:uncharacterized protein YqgC (DUF456 family)